MAKGKTTKFEIELSDGIGIIDGLRIMQDALREIDTKVEVLEDNKLQWDLSKNVPGYRVVMRDEGVGKPQKFIIGKEKRERKAKTA